MGRSSGYPKDISVEETFHRYCSKCEKYKVRDDNFQVMNDKRWEGKKSERYWSRHCRACLRASRDLVYGSDVPLSHYRRHIDWMIGVVGWKQTWKRIGVTRATLSYWLGATRSDGKVTRRLTIPSARKVITAAHQLNLDIAAGLVSVDDTIVYNTRGHCRGCGTLLEDYTSGCDSCLSRKAKRESRARLEATDPDAYKKHLEKERQRQKDRKVARAAAVKKNA